MELVSKMESVLVHYKDGEITAITHTNGKTELLKVAPMSQKDYQEFYETDTLKAPQSQ